MAAVSIYARFGLSTLNTLIWFKYISFALIALGFREYKRRELYFYYNCGISATALWIGAVVFDLVPIFFTAVIFLG